ncbi:MAG TPA: urate oxidase [Candidatus Limnocylindrales bacterium]|nr:urate oxidase [Candidatus Limnocylindrales bacterium]
MIELGENRYGKSAIRLVRVVRGEGGHGLRDLTVAVALEGDFAAAHVEGDNRLVVATDTMKNTVYALAREQLTGSIEAFGLALARHFAAFEQVERATVTLREHPWRPVDTAGGPAPDAFVRSGELVRSAVVGAGPSGESVESGVEELVVMKTTRSAFSGFPRDRYTTLKDTDDRLLATRMSAAWRYTDDPGSDHDRRWSAVLTTLLETFADHDSASVQATIWRLGRAVLERHDEVEQVRLTMPNLHHWLVDLSPFGQANENEIFVATSEPYGLIEATVRRGRAER